MKKIFVLLFLYSGFANAPAQQVSQSGQAGEPYRVTLLSPRSNTRSDQRPIHIGFYDAEADKTFVTWMGANSTAVVKELDHATGKWSADKVAGTSTFVDKHNYPGMLRGADGRIHIFYGCHNSVLRHAVSPMPLSIDGVWQDGVIEEAQRASYPAPIITDDGTFYVFYRDTRKTNGYSDDRPYQMVKSTDGGKTWKRQMIIDPFPRTTDNMCEIYNGKVTYQPAAGGQPARIHLAWTIAGEKLGHHAHATYGRNVYYAWLNPANDRLYNIEGIDLGATITNETLDKHCLVLDTGIPDVSHSAGLQVSAHYRDNGLPLIIFNSRQLNGLSSATWDAKSRSWQFTRIAPRSEPRETEKTGPESFRVYRPQGAQVQIYETSDAGANWTLVSTFSLPDGASVDRVHLIDNARPEARLLLTQSGDGEIREARRNVYIAGEANPRYDKPIQERRAQWMQEAGWGVMTHYLSDWQARTGGFEMSIDKWNEMVNGFDVEGLANQLQKVGAKYHMMTIGQNSGYYLAPNPVYDQLTGISPGKCSQRDLIADLSKALRKRGIRLIVYLPSGAPAGDRAAVEALEWTNGPYPNIEFQRKWEQIIAWWSAHWGDAIDGWWFDGCYWPNRMYRGAEPNFESFSRAARTGNPNSALAFCPGVVWRTLSVTPHEDYIAGEIDNPERISIRRVFDGLVDGSQLHILSNLGERWGMGVPRFTTTQIIDWSKMVINEKGAITWDVPVQINGHIPDEYMKQLAELGKALK